jgi:hypothetical protein
MAQAVAIGDGLVQIVEKVIEILGPFMSTSEQALLHSLRHSKDRTQREELAMELRRSLVGKPNNVSDRDHWQQTTTTPSVRKRG